MTPQQILNDPTASSWLKERVRELPTRDIVDMMADVGILMELLEEQLNDLMWEQERKE